MEPTPFHVAIAAGTLIEAVALWLIFRAPSDEEAPGPGFWVIWRGLHERRLHHTKVRRAAAYRLCERYQTHGNREIVPAKRPNKKTRSGMTHSPEHRLSRQDPGGAGAPLGSWNGRWEC